MSNDTTNQQPSALALAPCSAPKFFVRMFKPRFAALVEAGTKTQTVRPTPARMPKAGDKLSLRMWTGKPYRSKQREIRAATVLYVAKIKLDCFDMWFDGVRASEAKQDAFAIADGFSDCSEMLDWFENEHGLPFEGVVIVWQNTKDEPRREH
jgi:hypothetical protein